MKHSKYELIAVSERAEGTTP